jgi:hypothetical protein
VTSGVALADRGDEQVGTPDLGIADHEHPLPGERQGARGDRPSAARGRSDRLAAR